MITPEQLTTQLHEDLSDTLDDWRESLAGPEHDFAENVFVLGAGLAQNGETGQIWAFFRFARQSSAGVPDMGTEVGWRFPMALLRVFGFPMAAAKLAGDIRSGSFSDLDPQFGITWLGEPAGTESF